MKHTIQYFLAAAASLFLMAACQQTLEPMASSILVDKTDIAFVATGAAPVTMNVTSDGDWMTSAPAWVKLEPAYGSGNATVKVSVTDNVDEYGDVAGPRSGRIMIGGEKTVSVAVEQAGDKALDSRHIYKKVKTITSGKAYLIVADLGEGGLVAAKPVSGSYGYLNVQGVTAEADGSIIMSSGAFGFVFTEAEGGYTVTQSDGRTLYMQGTYNNFNVSDAPTAGHIFTAAFSEDGHLTLTNGYSSKWLQYSGNYSSYGAYDSEQANSTLPYLYEDSKAPSNEVLQVESENIEVSAKTTSLTVNVTANCEWLVRCHDEWITSIEPTSGNGNGSFIVKFAENESEKDAKTASIMVKGQETSVTITLTQKPIVTKTLPYTESLTPSIGDFWVKDVTGSAVWKENGNYGMTAKGNKAVTESWLISPRISLKDVEQAFLSFEQAANYFTNVDNFKSYTGLFVQEVGASEWTAIEPVNYPDGKSWTYVATGDIDLSAFLGKVVQIGLKYTSDATISGTWEVRNVKVKATLPPTLAFTEASVTVKPGATVSNPVTTNSTGAVTYSSSKPEVATVDANGVITGVADGSAVITAKVAAAGIYEAAEVKCDVTVSSQEVLTIAPTNFETAYPADAATTTVGGIEFGYLKIANFGSGIQMQGKKNAYIANNTSLGKISTIKVTVFTGKTWYPENLKLYAGAAANPSTEITPTSDGTSSTYDLSKGDYAYFKLANPSNYAVYLAEIQITYTK